MSNDHKNQGQKNDYSKLEFMCGLEIHQRIGTNTKLFCDCDTESENEHITSCITRRIRAVSGEMGKIDRSSKFEENKQRRFSYHISNNTSCLVEIDEEPPHHINKKALSIALGVCNAIKMKIPQELHVMRKEVVDGSDPSGFQRTIMIGFDGSIVVNGLEIKIPFISLEEESSALNSKPADENSKLNNYVVYNTSRLGLPLIEIDTSPYIPNPIVAKDVALYIGNMLRSTGVMKRGLGTIRQDVNVSIKGGARVEIKGLQDVNNMHLFIENEVNRQLNLIKIKEELTAKGAHVHGYKDITAIFSDCSKSDVIDNMVSMIHRSITKDGAIVLGIALFGFKGFLGREVNPNRRLGSEISDYAKMSGVKGLIHSDEQLSKYGITPQLELKIKSALELGADDAFILIAGSPQTVNNAITLAKNRAQHTLVGVLEETRAAQNNDLYTTAFMRPLPGGARMYPETDLLPIIITDELLNTSEEYVPRMEEDLALLEKELKNKELASRIMLSERYALYKKLRLVEEVDMLFVANVLLQKFTELSRNNISVDMINETQLIKLFSVFFKKLITKQAFDPILKQLAQKNSDVEDIISEQKLFRIRGKELELLIKSLFKPHTDINLLKKTIMEKHRLNIDGDELNALLNSIKKN